MQLAGHVDYMSLGFYGNAEEWYFQSPFIIEEYSIQLTVPRLYRGAGKLGDLHRFTRNGRETLQKIDSVSAVLDLWFESSVRFVIEQ